MLEYYWNDEGVLELETNEDNQVYKAEDGETWDLGIDGIYVYVDERNDERAKQILCDECVGKKEGKRVMQAKVIVK